jgi:hypothetical protein
MYLFRVYKNLLLFLQSSELRVSLLGSESTSIKDHALGAPVLGFEV